MTWHGGGLACDNSIRLGADAQELQNVGVLQALHGACMLQQRKRGMLYSMSREGL